MISAQVAQLVNRLENIMRVFFNFRQIPRYTVVKYRQGAFDVATSWQGPEDALERNIRMSVGEDCNQIHFEITAWRDDEATLKRRWTHRYAGAMRVEQYIEIVLGLQVGATLQKTFTEALMLKEEDLVNTSDLQPRPH